MDSRRPTSADVAALAGVSRTTVSFVLNGRDVTISPATRERVLDAARQLGSHPSSPARQLARGRTNTIALMLRRTPEEVAGDAFLPELLRGLTIAARNAGYQVIVETVEPSSGRYEEVIRAHRADGLVVSGPRSGDPELARLVREGVPLVVQGWVPDLEVASVDVDNRVGALRAVEHLIALGHQRIGCITNAPRDFTSASERLAGYHAALREARVEAGPEWVVEGSFDAASGRKAMARLLAQVDPTAVFVASDTVAVGAMSALREAGQKVPSAMSVVGFDDIPLAAHLDPPLTTVRLPGFELGQTVARVLLDRIGGPSVPTRTLLPTELIVRASTGPPGRFGASP
ncbi:MAG: LacI family DNA-binding transcriptional regulator [Chloroflexota bacterium]